MQEIVISVKGKPKKGDILVFNGEQWESKANSNTASIEIKELKKEIENLNNSLSFVKKEINEKFKSYHNILKMVTKEQK